MSTRRTPRVAELEAAIHRALEAACDDGTIGQNAFGVLQAVVHDGIPDSGCRHPDRAQKWFAMRAEYATRWCSLCGALNRGESWVAPGSATDQPNGDERQK